VKSLIKISKKLAHSVSNLSFEKPVFYTYNPLEYAFNTHCDYLKKYGYSKHGILFLGMNPGPWGMLQTGIPFGQIDYVKNWLKIKGEIFSPAKEHPKRLIEGFSCRRREVSGERLWNWISKLFRTPSNFFENFFVSNYCPLAFLEESGRNRIPEKLPLAERKALFTICDESLVELVKIMDTKVVVGIGKFAEKRAKIALKGLDISVFSILHPSPASPAANRGWAPQASKQMVDILSRFDECKELVSIFE